jgi:glucose/arabinose dehydrogenase
MKGLRAVVSISAFAALISFSNPVLAQTPAVATTPAARTRPFYYDVSKETTLSGTLLSVVKKPTGAMTVGSHLMVATAAGTIDGNLGRFAFEGKTPLFVTVGEQVQVRGVMNTIEGQQVFLVRSVKANGEVYVIRNSRGMGISPQARERASQKGEQL